MKIICIPMQLQMVEIKSAMLPVKLHGYLIRIQCLCEEHWVSYYINSFFFSKHNIPIFAMRVYFAHSWLSLDINTLITTSLSVVSVLGIRPCQTNLNKISVLCSMAGETGVDREGPSPPGPIDSISWTGPGGLYIQGAS